MLEIIFDLFVDLGEAIAIGTFVFSKFRNKYIKYCPTTLLYRIALGSGYYCTVVSCEASLYVIVPNFTLSV